MVERVEGWRASDGIVYADEERALEADARFKLKKLGIFNEATSNEVLRRAEEVMDALDGLATFRITRDGNSKRET